MWVWIPLWVAGTCCAAAIVMAGMGLRSNQPLTPFLGTPFMSAHIFGVLLAVAVLGCILHVVFEAIDYRAKHKMGLS